ncbi:EpsG family protein [Leptothrix discophora]|uniref:EpsG family protein n=1 Tax=Leptothrix discophora TaxID=89 RepID=A0ABT9G0M0_LEPDI|nr:EpsG family protein [Leptothrix discophora]MDP4299852.1 EpsG family protein [Leptothrix discophora]
MTKRKSSVSSMKVVALTLLFLTSIAAGWREWGADRDNYIQAYWGIVEGSDLIEKMFFAKDPLFLLIVSACAFFSQDPKFSFVFICLLSLYSKYYAFHRILSGRIAIFAILYIIFIAPGLEFAAMRAGLAIGFLMITVASEGEKFKKALFGMLAILAHTSLAPAVLITHPTAQRFLKRFPASYIAITIAIATGTPAILSAFPKWAYYEESQGTLFSLATPILVLVPFFLIFHTNIASNQSNKDVPDRKLTETCREICLLMVSLSFGITLIIPTASTRFLEIAWSIMLPIAIKNKRYAGLVTLLLVLVYLNLARLTWQSAIDPSLTS